MLQRFCGSAEAAPGESKHKNRSWFGRRGKYDVQTQFGATDDLPSFKKLKDQPQTSDHFSSSSSHGENHAANIVHSRTTSSSSTSPTNDSNRSSVHEIIDAPIFVKRDRAGTSHEMTAEKEFDLVNDSGIFACDKSQDILPIHRDPAFTPRVIHDLEFENRSEENSGNEQDGPPFVSVKLPAPRRVTYIANRA